MTASAKLPTLLVADSLRVGTAPPVSETPIAYITAWLRRRMPEFGGRGGALADRVLVVQAETGSGKSTVLPVEVFRLLRGSGTAAALRYHGPSVICTQPRILTAARLAADVSGGRNRDMVLGETVGYLTGPMQNSPATGLIYATMGVFAAQLRAHTDGEIMDMYRFIILDEAHERSLDADVTLLLLRNFYERNRGNAKLPFLLLTSATFNPARYAAYFDVGDDNVFRVKGRSYAIDMRWPERGCNDYIVEAARVCRQLHAEGTGDADGACDILVFVPGGAEAKAVVELLQGSGGSNGGSGGDSSGDSSGGSSSGDGERGMLLLTIDREVVKAQARDYQLLFAPPESLPRPRGQRPPRRVIVATVVAETGLTIETLKYVIDCGWNRSRLAFPEGPEGLVTLPVPRSRAAQRMGRVGRLFEGVFCPLYTQNVHAALDEEQLPEIFTSSISGALLTLVREQTRLAGDFRLEELRMLDPPPAQVWLEAAAAAEAQGFLDTAGGAVRLTGMGELAAAFPRAAPEEIRILFAGRVWGAASSDVCTLAALLAAPTLAVKPHASLDAALLAALPAYLRNGAAAAGGGAAGGGAAAPQLPLSTDERAAARARFALADDFLEALYIFDSFAAALDAGLPAAQAHCAAHGLSLEALLALAAKRDELADGLIALGLNPVWGEPRRLATASADEFDTRITALKRCLHDGLRARLLTWDDDAGVYCSPRGVRVRAPALLQGKTTTRLRALGLLAEDAPARARWLVTSELQLKPADAPSGGTTQRPLLWNIVAGRVSVLDGYVAVDEDFAAPAWHGKKVRPT